MFHPCLPVMTENTFASFIQLIRLKTQKTTSSSLLPVTLEQSQLLLAFGLGLDAPDI